MFIYGHAISDERKWLKCATLCPLANVHTMFPFTRMKVSFGFCSAFFRTSQLAFSSTTFLSLLLMVSFQLHQSNANDGLLVDCMCTKADHGTLWPGEGGKNDQMEVTLLLLKSLQVYICGSRIAKRKPGRIFIHDGASMLDSAPLQGSRNAL